MTTTLDIALRESPMRLEDVVVSAAPDAGSPREQYQSTATKSRADFLTSPGTSFAEKISDLPGVAVRGNGSAPDRPILRGLGDNEVLVLENGLRMGDLATFDPAHATPIDALSIAQVDVVRGPATILYGPSTIGGIVNVITDIVPEVSDRRVSGTAAWQREFREPTRRPATSTTCSATSIRRSRLSAGGVHGSDIRIPSSNVRRSRAAGAEFDLDRDAADVRSQLGSRRRLRVPGRSFGTIGIGGKHFADELRHSRRSAEPGFRDDSAHHVAHRAAAQHGRAAAACSTSGAGCSISVRRERPRTTTTRNPSSRPRRIETGVSDPQANHFRKRRLNAVVQLLQQPWGRLHGTLGLWTQHREPQHRGRSAARPELDDDGVGRHTRTRSSRVTPNTRLQAGLRYDYNKIQTHPYRRVDGLGVPDAERVAAVQRGHGVARRGPAVRRAPHRIVQRRALVPRADRAGAVRQRPRCRERHVLRRHGDARPETGYGVDASLRGTYSQRRRSRSRRS